MFNPHIHQQQQQQQQQFHQHLRQLQQLFQQQPPPPPPPQPPPGHHVPHHHQTPRALPVPPQAAPPPRMVNLCQATQTTIIAPNPMLQGAILMQQMQGNMRGFGMGGQQFRQFFAAGARSSLLGPVPMGMAIKSPMMGFPAARPFHPHPRYYNNNNNSSNTNSNTITTTAPSSSSTFTTDAAARQPDRKRDSEQMATSSTDDQPAASTSTSDEATDKTQTDGAVGGVEEPTQISEEQLGEPVVKRQRTEGSEEPKEQSAVETITIPDTDGEVLSSECNSTTEDTQPEDCIALEDGGSTRGSDVVEAIEETRAVEMHSCLSAPSPSGKQTEDHQQVNLPAEEASQDKDASLASPDNQDDDEEGVADGSNKFYCYLCSITCHNQQNFRSHMNSISHQQRMMEIQHMSNACLVTLLPRVQESLQGANKDGEKKSDSKRWCATCHTHFTSSVADHLRTEEHKLASKIDMSSCSICKKRFKNSQMFVEHLQSQEHRQKLQETGCEALAKLTALDTDGFSLEEEEGNQMEEVEERQNIEGDQGDGQDGWSSLKEVTLDNMASDEQYDPDTVYGSSFLVPVSGFICRLCKKFFNFESSAPHTHCKSLKHFENLKSYKEEVSPKGEAVESSGETLRPATETTTDCSDENLLLDDADLATDTSPKHPTIALTRLKVQKENQQAEAEPELTSQDSTSVSATSTTDADQDLSLHHEEEQNTSQVSSVQESPAEPPAGSTEEANSEPAAPEQGANEEEEKEAPAGPRKNAGTGKAKATPKRRSGRAANKR